jgi:hypothetical protein
MLYQWFFSWYISGLFEFYQEKHCWHISERFSTRNSSIEAKKQPCSHVYYYFEFGLSMFFIESLIISMFFSKSLILSTTEEMKLIAPPLTVAINFLRKKSVAINVNCFQVFLVQKTWKQLTFWEKSPAKKVNCFSELNCDQIRSTDSIFFRLRRAKIDIHFCIFTFKMLKIFACGGPKSISFIVFSPSKCYFFSPATD